MTNVRYQPRKPDGALIKIENEFWFQCCDCALVHKLVFGTDEGGLTMRVFYDEAETLKAREREGKTAR
jgi:hypothetical protein